MTVKETWETLQKFHCDNQMEIDIHYYFEELFTQQYVEGTLMGDHIAALLDLQQWITAMGKIIPNIWVVCTCTITTQRSGLGHGEGPTSPDKAPNIGNGQHNASSRGKLTYV